MMTVHVLHAGDGYKYLTRQVATADNARERGMSMSDYYMQHGNPPGMWVGSGIAELGVSGTVREAQMKALFGEGRHPDAERLELEALVRGDSPKEAMRGTQLGRAFPKFEEKEDDGYKQSLETAFATFRTEHGRDPEAGVERDLIRWDVAREFAQKAKDDRAKGASLPVTDAEVARYLATRGQQRQAVAGYDLVFTPSKSVSVLWGLGDQATRSAIEEAHRQAWTETLNWIETEGALTRAGKAGVRQLDTKGLVATAFDHLDSRTEDPNIHTHVAVSTKVLGVDGKWRSLDGRVLHAMGVAASERYNTRVEELTVEKLGVEFHTESRGRGKQGVREIVGIDKKVRETFSRRRAAIEQNYEELRADYRAKYGHEPPPAMAYRLAQQANLDTRDAKGDPVSLAQRLPQWRGMAAEVLGTEQAVDDMVRGALHPAETTPTLRDGGDLWRVVARDLAGLGLTRWTEQDIADALERVAERYPDAEVFAGLEGPVPGVADDVVVGPAAWTETIRARGDLVDAALRGVADKRATWGRFHLEAEAQRVARTYAPAGTDLRALTQQITGQAMAASLPITPPELNEVPDVMRRLDGESVYTVHGTERFTSLEVLEAEDTLLAAARTRGGLVVPGEVFERALSQVEAETGRRLNDGQRNLAYRFAAGGHQIEAGIGPAGTGKTTAMKAFARAVEADGGKVIGLGPSAAAAKVLGAELGTTADTLDMLLLAHDKGLTAEGEAFERLAVDEHTVLLIDESSLAGTMKLARTLDLAQRSGASVRLLGDPGQLGAVEAGGALRLIADQAGAAHLEEVHRFATPGEAEASLLIRDGNKSGLDFYIHQRRTMGGTSAEMIEEMFANWQADSNTGLTSLMIAATNDNVVELSTRARMHRVIRGEVEDDGVTLHDETRAGVGDIIVTRDNQRRLKAGPTDYVKNGDLWRVTRRLDTGGLLAKNTNTGAAVALPADYVAEHVELGYATTTHRVQGMTVDTSHGLVGVGMTRNEAYTLSTRGKLSNRFYVVVDEVLDVDVHAKPSPERAVQHALEGVLDRDGEEQSASMAIEDEWDYAHSLARLVPEYEDAYEAYLEPGRADRLADVARRAIPELAPELIEDPAWPSLAARLALHEAAGADPATLLQDAAAWKRGFGDAKSKAQVMHFRVGMPELLDLDGRGLPVWITPAPDAILPDDVDQPAPDVARPAVAAPVDEAARARAVEIHQAAWTWWTEQKTSQTWAGEYMGGRGLADAEWGVAPAGWTNLVDHLTAQGYTPEQLVEAGVATTTRRGAAIDRFRDRIVFPFRDRDGDIVGVTARINPAVDDPKAPKYLNTPATAAFRKSELLLGLDPDAVARLAAGARPVLVEGPTDVEAMKRMTPDDVPVAAAGTAVTEQQLQLLRDLRGRDLSDLVVALDGDAAGQKAAARVWNLLTDQEASHAAALVLPDRADPAQLRADGRADEVLARLAQPEALTHLVLDRAVDQIAQRDSLPQQVEILRDAVAQAAARVDPVEMPAAGAYLMERLDGVMPTESVFIAVNEEAHAAARARAPQAPEIQTNPVVASWLNAQANLIAERLDGLVDQAVDERPQWMASITDQPTTPGARHEWTTAVRQLVAYRDRYQVTDTDSPLGPAVGSGDQGTAYRAADQVLGSITRDEETSAPSSAPPARSMDRVAALLAEARARAAENDARQANPGDQARREAEERQRRERELHEHSRDDGLER